MKLIDVSVPLDATLPTYPHNTPFSLEPIKRLASGDSSNVSTLHMSAHCGTHVDAPRHFFDSGPGTEALPLDLLMGRVRVIQVTSRTGIAAEDLATQDFSEDVRILIKTRNSLFWGTPEFRHRLHRRDRVWRAPSRRARRSSWSASTISPSNSSTRRAHPRTTCFSEPERL